MDHWIREWLYYSFAAGSLHTKKFCSTLYSIEVHFYSKKTKKITFWATLSGLRGNICTPSVARWKACGRLYVRHNWTCFVISYGWDVVSRNRSMSAFFGGVCHFECRFQREGASPVNHCWCHNSRVIALLCGIKIFAVLPLVLLQSTCVTDGQMDGRTDRQTELWLTRPPSHMLML